MKYRHISADSHLVVPCENWLNRVPAKYPTCLPRRVRLSNGRIGYVAGTHLYNGGMSQFAGQSSETFEPAGLGFDDRPGAGSPEERVTAINADGIDAEILFPDPGARRIWRGIESQEAYRNVVRAYNEYLALDYCSAAPDRLIGVGIIPETGVNDALTELQVCARLGFKAINLARFPSGLGHPTAEDDRFWAATIEIGMPVTIHVAFDPKPGDILFDYPLRPQKDILAGDFVSRLARYGLRGAQNATQMVMAGVFDRHPSLKIYWAENQIGWIPIFLEQIDHNYERHHYWAERMLGVKPLKALPSQYIREHNYWGFFNDRIGVRLRHEVGVDRLLWGSDFPHAECEWPQSMAFLAAQLEGVPEEERSKIVARNAIEFFHLQGD